MILNILSMDYLSEDIRTRGLYLGSHWLLCKMTLGATLMQGVPSIQPRLHPLCFQRLIKK